MKSCSKCGRVQPLTEFSPRGAMRDGHRSDCKSCCRKASRSSVAKLTSDERRAKYAAEYQRHRDKKIARAKAWKAQNAERAQANTLRSHRVTGWHVELVSRARTLSRKRRAECDLTPEVVLSIFEKQGGRCFWLNVPLEPSIAARHPLQPSLDRIDPSKGYVRGNVVLACQFANMGRSATDAQRFREFVDRLVQHVRQAT